MILSCRAGEGYDGDCGRIEVELSRKGNCLMLYLLRLLSLVGLLALCAITQAADPLNVFLDE